MKASVKIDLDRRIGKIDRNIYGHFLSRRPGVSEGGLYAPDSPTADEHGLRRDVVSYISDLRPPLIRWPGGCTGTTYHWRDGVGPIEKRPRNIDLHFGWLARYEFGTDEFIAFCRRLGAEPHLNLAMGTGSLEEAAAWVEYCNGKLDSTHANLRRQHGHEEPYKVRYWQLGNEMFGPWEIGYCRAGDYAAQAREWAKVLRRLDPSISLIAVGGGNWCAPEWSWEVAPEVAPYVDYISYHTYWRAEATDRGWYQMMAGPHEAEQAIDVLSAIIRLVRRRNRLARDLAIAVTEWNAAPEDGMMSHHPELKPFGSIYTLRDALAVATFINIMQRHCRDVTLATVAQPINVVGLIVVNDQGVWREPVYWPLWMQVRYSGPIALDALVECDGFDEPPSTERILSRLQTQHRPISGLPYLDCSVTLDPGRRKLFVSLVNRHKDDALQVEIAIPEARVGDEGMLHVLYHEDGMAMNSATQPDNVAPASTTVDGLDPRTTVELMPHSYCILELDLR